SHPTPLPYTPLFRSEARVRDAVSRRGLRERAIPMVDEQQVGAVCPFGPFGSGDGDIEVQVAVAIDVHHRCAGGPTVRGDSRSLGDVLEPHVALVQIQ